MKTTKTKALPLTKKYVLVPGFIRSENDGDRHYIGAGQLAQIYGVDVRECIVINRPEDWRGKDFRGLTWLSAHTEERAYAIIRDKIHAGRRKKGGVMETNDLITRCCAVCGKKADAFWTTGNEDLSICLECSIVVFPRLIADAISGSRGVRGRFLGDAYSVLARAKAEFWKGIACAALRRIDEGSPENEAGKN